MVMCTLRVLYNRRISKVTVVCVCVCVCVLHTRSVVILGCRELSEVKAK